MMTNLNSTFSALSDGTRRAILARLSDGELPVSQLAEPFEMSLTAVSKHVRILQNAGLVNVEKRGRTRHCRLQAAPMKNATDWLSAYSQFWEGQLSSLAQHLSEEGK